MWENSDPCNRPTLYGLFFFNFRDKLDDPRMLTTMCVLLGLNFTMAGDGDVPMDTSEPPPRPTSRPKEAEKRKEPSEDTSNLTESQKQVK